MKQPDEQDLKNFAPQTPPEEILKVVIDEMRKPIISIDATIRLLLQGQPENQEDQRAMLGSIPQMTTYLKALFDKVDKYLEARN